MPEGPGWVDAHVPVNPADLEIRYVPITKWQRDVFAELASLLVKKDVSTGIVAAVGAVPADWDAAND